MKHAFTTRYNGRARALTTEVGVFLPVTQEEIKTSPPQVKKYVCIWDTGATNSVITKKVADDLNLQPTGLAEVNHAGGKSFCNIYLVNIILPDNVVVAQVRVTEGKLISTDNIPEEKKPQVLIGMDIIGMGDFAVTNANGKTTLSFRTPSVEEIDFVPMAQASNVMDGGNRQQRRAMDAKMRRKR